MNAAPTRVTAHSPEETGRLAKSIAERLTGGEVIALTGELGAGKTHFVKGLAEGLGIDPNIVTSPTFVLINEYEGRLHVYHFDAYRLSDTEELEALGCYEMFAGDGVCVLEWADRVVDCLPADHLAIHIEHTGPTTRGISLTPKGPRYQPLELIDRIYRDRVLRARQTPPEEKLLDGARLFDMSCRIMMDGIRHEHPDADEERVREILVERVRLLRRLEEAR